MRSPAAANSHAMARPMPRDAPVIKTARPLTWLTLMRRHVRLYAGARGGLRRHAAYATVWRMAIARVGGDGGPEASAGRGAGGEGGSAEDGGGGLGRPPNRAGRRAAAGCR